MQVILKPPSLLEAKPVDQKQETPGFSVEPIFYEPRGKGVAAFIEITNDDGAPLFRGLITINGRTGAVDILQRTRAVKAEIDAPKKKDKK